MRLLWVRYRCFVHATEDETRVRDALQWVMARESEPGGAHRIERRAAKGHWGNDIVVLEAALKGKREVESAVERVLGSPSLREEAAEGLGRHLDEDGVLHLRVDKQEAVQRRLRFTDGSDAMVVLVKGSDRPPANFLTSWHRFLSDEPRPEVGGSAQV